jgi:NADPH:quinone reductase-like Zn-dependent oxidoreductase
VQKGDAVLITAASSSVGLAAIQIVNALGGIPIATTLTGAKKAAVLKAGAAHVIATQEEPLLDSLRSILGENNLKIAFDAVGGPQIAEIAEGTIIVHGALSPETTPFPLKIALRKSLTVRGYVFTEVIKNIERFRRAKQFIHSGLSEGTLKPVIDRSFKFEEIVAAHHYLESNQQIGKIVVELD